MGTAPYPDDPPVLVSSDITAESHLNWLLQILLFVDAVHYLFLHVLGGGTDGVVAVGSPPTPTDALKTQETSTPGMTVQVLKGAALIDGGIAFNPSTWTSDTLAAPVTNDRIDTVQIAGDTWTISVKQGVEAGSPTAPAVDANNLKLAEIYHRVGEAAIEDADYSGSSNGYLTDSRIYCNV